MYRGNNKEFIFANDNMKQMFLELMKSSAEEIAEIAAYCIMSNHVHLVVKSGFEDLSKFSAKLNKMYAFRYNAAYNRSGHAFEDRFRSEPIDDDAYLTQVIRYIHNNPVNAGLSDLPRYYKWSSYNEYLNNIPVYVDLNQMTFIFDVFGSKDSFEDYHRLYDDKIHLDTSEDQNNILDRRIQKIITDFFKSKGLEEQSQLLKNEERMKEIIFLLQTEVFLSRRKISKILGTTESMVRYLSTKE
jgi:REP element-mobilizing transposase RayT